MPKIVPCKREVVVVINIDIVRWDKTILQNSQRKRLEKNSWSINSWTLCMQLYWLLCSIFGSWKLDVCGHLRNWLVYEDPLTWPVRLLKVCVSISNPT